MPTHTHASMRTPALRRCGPICCSSLEHKSKQKQYSAQTQTHTQTHACTRTPALRGCGPICCRSLKNKSYCAACHVLCCTPRDSRNLFWRPVGCILKPLGYMSVPFWSSGPGLLIPCGTLIRFIVQMWKTTANDAQPELQMARCSVKFQDFYYFVCMNLRA